MPYKDIDARRRQQAQTRERRREELRAYHKAWREKNRAHCAAYRKQYRGKRGPAHRRDRYGLSPEDFNAMVDAQGGKCAICARAPSGEGTMAVLRVDHDHDTGAVRALLCHGCNAALGLFRDDPTLLLKAAWYLRGHAKGRRESA